MERYEYDFVEISAQLNALERIREIVQRRAEQGWRLVSVGPFRPHVWLLIFERPVPTEI